MIRNTNRIRLVLTALAITGFALADAVVANEYTITDLGTLGGPSSYGNDTNDAGQVVGTAALPGGHPEHPFLWENGVMTDLGTLGGCCSYGYDLNDVGQVTGLSYLVDGTYHAFLWEDGVVDDLGALPGFEYSRAGGINDSGQVIGYSSHVPWGGSPDYTAFLWEGGVMIDL
ncbi:MAG: HAF repeat-containing protein, partial [Planctomycetota bacterium]